MRELPFPWRHVATQAVGGLTAIGFSADSAYLLVESHAGLGLFELASGRRVARSADDLPNTGLARPGIGPIDGEIISMAGLWGGRLPVHTVDGWTVRQESPEFLVVCDHQGRRHVIADTVSDFRAAGFSGDGAAFACATAADVSIFIRSTRA
jgi:hypothetical protein